MFMRMDHFIGGKWLPADGANILEIISPTSEEVVGRVPEATTDDVDSAVASARAAFDNGPWPRLSVKERAGSARR
jgi:betaine-aldehyde dehydrogenase